MFDGSSQKIVQATPTTSNGYAYVESTTIEPLIDNKLYSYILEVDLPGGSGVNLSLINIRIHYDFPDLLPTVQDLTSFLHGL